MSAVPIPVRRAVRAGGFAAITAAMLPPFALRLSLADEANRAGVRDRWVRRWSDALLTLFAVSPDVRGLVAQGSGRGRLVVANHRSTIDIAILLRTFGGRMVSRGDLSGWPLLGAAAKSVGTIFVDRGNAMSGATTIRAMRDALRAGDTVCLFPEGTTFEGDVVRPFHTGAFVSALRSRAEIVPVGLAYERGSGAAFVGEPFLKHLERMAGADPTRVVARVGEPFVVGERARAIDLCTRAHAAVQELVTEARAICDA
ncbi:MAG: lysophospholipid acyltransferase family protein [Polyangiaceae bacterium]